jgi:hypothetical protein
LFFVCVCCIISDPPTRWRIYKTKNFLCCVCVCVCVYGLTSSHFQPRTRVWLDRPCRIERIVGNCGQQVTRESAGKDRRRKAMRVHIYTESKCVDSIVQPARKEKKRLYRSIIDRTGKQINKQQAPQ